MGDYCHRCDREFKNYQAMQQHLDKSSSHHECEVCSFDGQTRSDLMDHYRSTKHGIECNGCPIGSDIWIPNSQSFQNHLRDANVCVDCTRHFDSQSNLQQHRITHKQLTFSCYGCSRKFKTYPGMIIHLEYGTCNQNFNRLILNQKAAQCYQWRRFVVRTWRNELLEQADLDNEYSEVIRPFECPGCDTFFTKLSGLFQHADTDACPASLTGGSLAKLRRWLKRLKY